MRIARALALAGIASRRKCEKHISAGRVSLNGEVVTDLGRQVNLDEDLLLFQGSPVHQAPLVYFLLNKPRGYTTTASDPHARRTVFQLLPQQLVSAKEGGSGKRVFPVGRLDRDSVGLLLFTNDGELANKLLHPRHQVGKWYRVRIDSPFDRRDRNRMLRGIRLADGIARVKQVKVVSSRVIELLICEGRKREVRRIFLKMGYRVEYLLRTTMGPLNLGTLPVGHGRFLKRVEIQKLKELGCS